MRACVAVLFALLGASLSSCTSAAGTCAPDGVGCACSVSIPCQGTLACRSDICIDLSDGPGASGGTKGTAGTAGADGGPVMDGGQTMDGSTSMDAASSADANGTVAPDAAGDGASATTDAGVAASNCYTSPGHYALTVCAAPEGCSHPTYTSTAEGTVKTSCCGLEWQQSSDVMLPWEAANAYCSDLTLASGGWRLPTSAELLSLVDSCESLPSIDGVAFPNTPVDYAFWTATSAMPSIEAEAVDFGPGELSLLAIGMELHVRCVRTAP